VGFGGIASFLFWFALKRIRNILAVIARVFVAALMYLESQHIVHVNWDKLQTISNGILSTITTATTNKCNYYHQWSRGTWVNSNHFRQ
jgi:uncharacterized membrane protein (Fun14 family)